MFTGLVSGAFAETVVIDFDDYEGPLMPIPEGYAGFPNWGSFAYSSETQPPVYVPHSGSTYTVSVGSPAPIVFDDYYVFSGAWFIGYASNGIAYELYEDDVVVYTSEVTMLDETYQWIPSGYDGMVNKVLILYAVGTNTWAMDDFTYETSDIPVQSTTWGVLKSLYR
jgi:hypothetical protein